MRAVAPIGERSIDGVFRRKFSAMSDPGYLRRLGRDSGLSEHERQEVVGLLRHSVRRLLQPAGTASSRRDTVVYGDLKPEHVYVHGSGLQFIDPAVQRAAGPEPDVAKLAGRTLLLAVGHQSSRDGRQIVRGSLRPSSGRSRRCLRVSDHGTCVKSWLCGSWTP